MSSPPSRQLYETPFHFPFILSIRKPLLLAENFPARPIKILVYTKPGGAVDIFARKFKKSAEKLTSARFLVVNKPGAGGIIALKALEKSKPDGYTIAAITKSNIGKISTHASGLSLDQFHFLARLETDPEALIVSENSPYQSWPEILKQSHSSALLWVGPALGGNDHILAQKIWKKSKISGQWVPYPSGNNAMAALMGQHGHIYVGNPGDTIGKPNLKILAVSAPKRLPAPFDQVATFKEVGIQDLDQEMMWRGFIAPKGLDSKVLTYFDNLFSQLIQDKEWKKFISSRGAQPVYEVDNDFKKTALADLKEFKEFENSKK